MKKENIPFIQKEIQVDKKYSNLLVMSEIKHQIDNICLSQLDNICLLSQWQNF